MTNDAQIRILIVDDSQAARSLLSKSFSKCGFEVTTATGANEALQLALNTLPNVIITDLEMPEVSGIEFCRMVKQNSLTKGIPVIMLTSHDDHDTLIDAANAGADDFISKNSPFEILLVKIDSFLRLADIQRQLIAITKLDIVKSIDVTYSHEIRNPMTVILGCVTIMEKMRLTEGHPFADQIRKSANQVLTILEEIRRLEKIHTQSYLNDKNMLQLTKKSS